MKPEASVFKQAMSICTVALAILIATPVLGAQALPTSNISVDWAKSTISKSTPTLQVVVNPMLLHGSPMHDGSFQALHMLGADYVRYVPWLPYPRQAVAELAEPKNGQTSWDFSHIDPTLDDFMRATDGHSVVLNFSTIPAWMYRTDKPVMYPDDPNQVFWTYTQGTELRDPSMKEVSEYFARLLAWYTQGGFTDEVGRRHESGHHYKVAYWEVLNEIDFEHHWSPDAYTRFYDTVTAAMLKVQPSLKFMALAVAQPSKSPEYFEYFLNPAHHRNGAPLDFITYHFYATPAPEEDLNNWQYTFFNQEEGFLSTVRFVESIRKRYMPTMKTDLNELGVILPEDEKEINSQQSGAPYIARDEPRGYWNLAGAMYADLFGQCAKMGIDVVGESQLVGYKSQFPSVSMMDYKTSEPNARLWVLKLLLNNFGPGDKLAEVTLPAHALYAAYAFDTKRGRKLLVINKHNVAVEALLPQGVASSITFVAPSTGDHEPQTSSLSGSALSLEPFEVAVVSLR